MPNARKFSALRNAKRDFGALYLLGFNWILSSYALLVAVFGLFGGALGLKPEGIVFIGYAGSVLAVVGFVCEALSHSAKKEFLAALQVR
jgi:hypothetical protein